MPPSAPSSPLLGSLRGARDALRALVDLPHLAPALEDGARVIDRSIALVDRGSLTTTAASLVLVNVAVARAALLQVLGRRALHGDAGPVDARVSAALEALRRVADAAASAAPRRS